MKPAKRSLLLMRAIRFALFRQRRRKGQPELYEQRQRLAQDRDIFVEHVELTVELVETARHGGPHTIGCVDHTSHT